MPISPLSFWNSLCCFSAGAFSGFAYFYALYKTITLLPKMKRKGLFLFSSFLLRILILLSLLGIMAQDNVLRVLAFLFGFMVMRFFYVSKQAKKLPEGAAKQGKGKGKKTK